MNYGNSLTQIEHQLNSQKQWQKNLKEAGLHGRMSLLRNFVARNTLLSQQQGQEELVQDESLDSQSSRNLQESQSIDSNKSLPQELDLIHTFS